MRPVAVRECALEVDQVAEWALPDDFGMHRHVGAVDLQRTEGPIGLAVTSRHSLEHLAAGGDRLAERGMRQRIDGVLIEQARRIGGGAKWTERRMLDLIPVIEGEAVQSERIERHCPAFRLRGATQICVGLRRSSSQGLRESTRSRLAPESPAHDAPHKYYARRPAIQAVFA